MSDQDHASKDTSIDELTRAFEKRIWETVRDSPKKCGGYHPGIFRQMIADKGPLDTVKQLLRTPHLSEGFETLVMCNHPELTAEAVACDRRWSCLFTKAEIDTARKRLAAVGYFP